MQVHWLEQSRTCVGPCAGDAAGSSSSITLSFPGRVKEQHLNQPLSRLSSSSLSRHFCSVLPLRSLPSNPVGVSGSDKWFCMQLLARSKLATYPVRKWRKHAKTTIQLHRNTMKYTYLISSHLCMVECPLNIPDSPLHGPHSAECCLDSSSSSPPKNPLKGTSGQEFWEKDLYNLRNKFWETELVI